MQTCEEEEDITQKLHHYPSSSSTPVIFLSLTVDTSLSKTSCNALSLLASSSSIQPLSSLQCHQPLPHTRIITIAPATTASVDDQQQRRTTATSQSLLELPPTTIGHHFQSHHHMDNYLNLLYPMVLTDTSFITLEKPPLFIVFSFARCK